MKNHKKNLKQNLKEKVTNIEQQEWLYLLIKLIQLNTIFYILKAQ